MSDRLPVDGIEIDVTAAGPARAVVGGWLLPPGPVELRHPLGDAEFYRHGWNSWSPSGWTRLSGPALGIRDRPDRLLTADDAATETPHAHSGAAVGALAGPDGQVLLLGALGLGTPRVGADASTLWGRAESDEAEWFVAYGDEHAVFASYVEQLRARLGTRQGRAGGVWSSWYSFYEEIDERLVTSTVALLAGEPLDVIQLDDGWEPRVGDWVAGPDFPSGMAAVARGIRDAGFRAGLWLAPFIALPDSELARTRPELLVRGDDGHPLVTGHNWGAGYFSLDTTLPAVQEHLREVFARVTGWGFDYLKLDFLYAGAVPGVRSTDQPRERVYREAVRLIRDAVGDDVYLLGCGAPMIPSVGVFDGVRVGPDVAAFWDRADDAGDPSAEGARNALVASIEREWMRGLYELDPDAVYFRTARSELDAGQRQLLRDTAEILGFRQTSDPVSWLSDAEHAQLRAWFAAPPAPVERIARHVYRVDGRVVDLRRFVAER